jgi:hypothetical protein
MMIRVPSGDEYVCDRLGAFSWACPMLTTRSIPTTAMKTTLDDMRDRSMEGL